MKKSVTALLFLLSLVPVMMLTGCRNAATAPEESAVVKQKEVSDSIPKDNKTDIKNTDDTDKGTNEPERKETDVSEILPDMTEYITVSDEAVVSGCEHRYASKVLIEATCNSTGVRKYTCTLCGNSYKESIPMKEHTIIKDNAVKATCTHSGLTEGSHCSVCGTVITAQKETTKADHSKVVAKRVDATCVEDGYIEYKCSVCGEESGRETIPVSGHNYVNGICTNCGTSAPDNPPSETTGFILPMIPFE